MAASVCKQEAGVSLSLIVCLSHMLPGSAADGRYKGFNHPVVLSCAGLLSAAVSTYKYWGS